MKKCPYCGKEYPDDATVCATDNELLRDETSRLGDATPRTKKPYLLFPDYKWTAWDAWKCLVAILVLTVGIGVIVGLTTSILHLPFPMIEHWLRTGLGYLVGSVFAYSACLLPALYFARTKNTATFLAAFGLASKPSTSAWIGVILALIIRCHGHFYGWGKMPKDIVSFESTAGLERYFFLVPLLLFAPCIEEIINRGFLYKAFRGSYSMEVSMVMSVLWTIFTHWSECDHAPSATFDLSALTIVLCYLRERSNSLWDCILCHFTYNASLLAVVAITSR